MPTVTPSIKNSPTWRRDVGNLSMVSVSWSVTESEEVDVSEVDPYDLLELPVGWEIQFIEAARIDGASSALTFDLGIKGGDTDLFFDGAALNGSSAVLDSRAQAAHKPYQVNALNQRLMMTLGSSGTDIPDNDSVEIMFFVYFIDRGAR